MLDVTAREAIKEPLKTQPDSIDTIEEDDNALKAAIADMVADGVFADPYDSVPASPPDDFYPFSSAP